MIDGTVASSVCQTPLRLVSTIELNTGSEWASGSPIATTPALAMTMSTSPSSSIPALHRGLQLGQVAYVGDDGHDLAAGGLDQPCGLVEIGFGPQRVGNRVDIGADVHGDDVGALFGQRHGVAATLAARGAGDDGDRVVEFTHDGQRTWRLHA